MTKRPKKRDRRRAGRMASDFDELIVAVTTGHPRNASDIGRHLWAVGFSHDEMIRCVEDTIERWLPRLREQLRAVLLGAVFAAHPPLEDDAEDAASAPPHAGQGDGDQQAQGADHDEIEGGRVSHPHHSNERVAG